MFNTHHTLLSEQFLLLDLKSYNFLSNGPIQLPNMDDRQEFKATLEAMRDMGITQEELDPIFKIISAVMLFGNMEFKQVNNILIFLGDYLSSWTIT